ncbi:macrolide transport system ATP-binding/permease protein [Microbacterium trichothecenolyticum]|uniref:ATP-binding cassette domain-containing protein n=1 Tax=Microbacterium trichothecenolyticum TaxID=69370 RepID=UPI00285C7A84|nr:ATP-binding cassette domain-containing protein [Microbacterium trichothecenolyticum]MDR7183072.1 macrolide transport system ATP-binding/permease protein [Microbacterium trichothecenolyticum]
MPSLTHTPARDRAQLTAARVSFSRAGHRILNDVDLVVTPSSRMAIVGENGRGKSTLLHLLAGVLVPDGGDIARVGTLALAEQEMPKGDRRTVGDAVAEAIADALAALHALDEASVVLSTDDPTGAATDAYAEALDRAVALDAWDAERRVEVALEALGAETDRTRPLAELSVGQRYRVRLACLLGADHDFLLLDEPTNHLDRHSLDFLTAQLRARAGGVVVVSHDRALLADVADTFVDLDPTSDDRPRVYGGFDAYREGREAERERWEQLYDREQAERTRLQDDLSAAQNRLVTGWQPEKGSPKHGRATRAAGITQTVHRRRAALEAHAVTVPPPPMRFAFPALPSRGGAALLVAEDVHLDGRMPRPVSLVLHSGARVVVTGPNGAGKSTLLAALAGAVDSDHANAAAPEAGALAGAVRRGGSIRLSLLRQESVLDPDRRASELYDERIGKAVASGALAASQATGLSALGLLTSRETGRRVGELSMGQVRRLDLALALAVRPHVLLLDEPTNHLSFTLVDELTAALQATDAAVVVSTHDRQLLRDVGEWDRIDLGVRV